MQYLGKTEVKGVATQTQIVTTNSTTVEMQPGKFYDFCEITELTITLATPETTDVVNEYAGTFSTGDTIPTVTWPDSVVWQYNTPVLINNRVYEFSILNNKAVIIEFNE